MSNTNTKTGKGSSIGAFFQNITNSFYYNRPMEAVTHHGIYGVPYAVIGMVTIVAGVFTYVTYKDYTNEMAEQLEEEEATVRENVMFEDNRVKEEGKELEQETEEKNEEIREKEEEEDEEIRQEEREEEEQEEQREQEGEKKEKEEEKEEEKKEEKAKGKQQEEPREKYKQGGKRKSKKRRSRRIRKSKRKN